MFVFNTINNDHTLYNICSTWCLDTVGRPFIQGLQISRMEQKGSSWKLFSRNDIGSTLYNARELTQDGVFGETNFVEVPKIHQIYGPQNRVPYGIRISTCY